MKTKKITEIKNGYPKKIIVDNKQIVSYLAKWAIRQSPYCIPANLEKALFILFSEPTWFKGSLTILDCSASA